MKKLVRNLVIGAAACAALWYGGDYGWRWWTLGRFLETTDNAYVRADVTLVAPKVAGYVASVEVDDNQPVEAEHSRHAEEAGPRDAVRIDAIAGCSEQASKNNNRCERQSGVAHLQGQGSQRAAPEGRGTHAAEGGSDEPPPVAPRPMLTVGARPRSRRCVNNGGTRT